MKISQLTEITQGAAGDYLPILDVSDTTQSSTGSTRKIQNFNIIQGSEISKASGSSDSTQLNTLITLINSRGGGKLYSKAGSYDVNAVIKACSNLEWIIEEGAVFTAKNALNGDMIQNLDRTNGNSNITIVNLNINGNRSNQSSGNGLNLKNCTNLSLYNVTAYNTKLHGIHLDGSLSSMIWVEKCITDLNFGSGINIQDGLVNVYVSANRSTNSGQANIAIGGFGSYITIVDNFCDISGLDGSHVADNITGYSPSNVHITVSRNKCYSGGNHNIHIGGNDLIVEDNQLDISVQDGIRIASLNNATTVDGFSVRGNKVKNSGVNNIYVLNAKGGSISDNRAKGQTVTEILCDTVSDTSIIGNDCSGNGTNSDGIRLHKSSRNKVIGNTSKNNGRYGVYITDDGVTTSRLNQIVANNCYDDQSIKTQLYGIFSANSADYNIYTNNIIRAADHVTGSSSLAGSNNTTANNIT